MNKVSNPSSSSSNSSNGITSPRSTSHNNNSNMTATRQHQRNLARTRYTTRRRIVLGLFLTLAFSPSLLALYFLSRKNMTTLKGKGGMFGRSSPSGRSGSASSRDRRARQQVISSSKVDTKPSMTHYTATTLLQECANNSNSNNNNNQLCCVRWELNTDDWWTQHPDWTSTNENETHTCFQRHQNPKQIQFLQKLHQQQWQTDCREVLQKPQISSGYAAALMAMARSFYVSFLDQRPFQYTTAHAVFRWNFATNNTKHWSYCPTQDLNCYFLSISPCPASVGQDTAARGTKPSSAAAKAEFRWLRQYAYRPRHVLRKQLQQYLQTRTPPHMRTPCIAMHVRRTDIAFGRGRRYAAVHEYLEAANLTRTANNKNDNNTSTIVLLTDDVSTIDEVKKMHAADYNWVYLDRPRFRGTQGGFEGFIPSQDPALEILAIMGELQLASQCHTLVHGKSGFVALIIEAMQNAGHYNEIKTVYLQTQQDKKQQAKIDPNDRAEVYLQQIQEQLVEKKQQKKES